MKDARRALGPWLLAGAVAWGGVLWLGLTLWRQSPPLAGFDLALLLEGARRIAAGQSPYDPAMLAGASPSATDLFYSYPPPVAQAMVSVAWLPDGVVLVLWAVGATAGLALVAWCLARLSGHDPAGTAVRTVAIAPLFLPFAIALLFGNLDVWYPLAFGVLLVASLPGASSRTRIAGGVGIALAAVAKLSPAVLIVWVAAVTWGERGGSHGRILAVAVVTGLAVVGVSLAVWGVQPWLDYVTVIRVGAGATLVDPRNLGPVSLLGQATGMDEEALRVAQAVVSVTAVAACVWAGLRVRDPLAGFTVATVASLVVLPVTWYHYPVALIPVGIALAVGRPSARPWVLLALVLGDLALAFGPLLWLAVAVLVGATLWTSRPQSRRVEAYDQK